MTNLVWDDKCETIDDYFGDIYWYFEVAKAEVNLKHITQLKNHVIKDLKSINNLHDPAYFHNQIKKKRSYKILKTYYSNSMKKKISLIRSALTITYGTRTQI